jgi:hypothetical protein
MKKTSPWHKSIALLALVLSTICSIKATATTLTTITTTSMILESELTVSHKKVNSQLAQGLVGQCRAAARAIFIYQEPSTSNPLRVLQPEEQVTLAGESSRRGWIAINSPIKGFVQAKDLKPCFDDASVSPLPPPNLCRRVRYSGTEGVAVRVRPDKSSPQVGKVFFQDQVTLSNPPRFVDDNERRQWVRIAAPTVGWMSNGLPSEGSNLEACFF